MEKEQNIVVSNGGERYDGAESPNAPDAYAVAIKSAKRNLYIKVAVWMCLWFASIVVVFGHFALYYSRKGDEAHRQEIILKAGTAFAFIFKAVLGSAVGMAIVPMMWLTVSTEVFTFGGLDNLFNVNRSVTSLLSKEVLIKAKMVAFFGIILVLVGISGIAPPGTLTVERLPNMPFKVACNAPSLNMGKHKAGSAEETGDLWYINSNQLTYGDAFEAISLIALASYGGSILPMVSPCREENCTFSTEFVGPALKCEKISLSSKDAPWNNPGPNQQETTLINNTFFGMDFEKPLMYETAQDQDDGNIWLKWSTPKKGDIKYTSGGIPSLSLVDEKPIDTQASICALYNTTYNVDVEFTRGIFNVTDFKTEYIAPYNTSLRTNYVEEEMDVRHEIWRAFGVMDTLYFQILSGTNYIEQKLPGEYLYDTQTNLVSTKLSEVWLIDSGTSKVEHRLPLRELHSAVEELYRNITISMLARSLPVRTPYRTTCTEMRGVNVYKFDILVFWASYGAGILLGLIAIAVGARSMFKMGYARDSSFTAIAATTMDRKLDDIVMQASEAQHGAIVERQLSEVKVKFNGGFKVYDA